MANKNGKKGSEKHQDVQNKELEKAKKEYKGKKVKTEVVVPTPNGLRENRVADVGVYSWIRNMFHMKFHKIIQIGKTNKDGTPVKREQKAIEDIEAHTGIKVTFIDYENYNLDEE